MVVMLFSAIFFITILNRKLVKSA